MNIIRITLIAAGLLLVTSGETIAEKARDWQVGTVRDSSQSRTYAGSVGNGTTQGSVSENGSFTGSSNSNEVAIYRVYQDFVIEGDEYVYFAAEHLKWRWSKPADLTVNGKVKYVAEKRKLYVLDDLGKEHEMEIIKKALRNGASKP